MNKLNDLVNGKIGRVVVEGDDNGFDCGDDDWMVVEGKKMFVGEEVSDIDEFEFDEKDLVLFEGDGYRGVCCYNGVVKVNDKWFWMDIMNDYMVYELIEE